MTLWSIAFSVEDEFNVDPPPSGDPTSRYVSVIADYEAALLVLGSPETPPQVMHCEVTTGLVPHQKFLDDAAGCYSTLISFFDIGLLPDTLAKFAQISREVVIGDPNRRVVSFRLFIRKEMLLPTSDSIEQYMLDFEEDLFALGINGIKGAPDESLKYISLEETAEEKCLICSQEFGKTLSNSDGGRDQRIVRTPCSHVYHKHCTVQRLKTNNKCPLCT